MSKKEKSDFSEEATLFTDDSDVGYAHYVASAGQYEILDFPGPDDYCFDDVDTIDVAKEYSKRYEEIQELETKLARCKIRIKNFEDHIIEKMAEQQMQSVKIGIGKGKTRTIYQKRDFIVSKASGVETKQVISELVKLGWKEMVSEGFHAGTLKASCKEAIKGSVESKNRGEAWVCFKTGEYFVSGEVINGVYGSPPVHPKTGDPIIKVIDGLPQSLRDLLYIEETVKLGTRSS